MSVFATMFPFFFIFLLPRIAATRCGSSSCHHGTPLIRFPFRLAHYQPSDCGYSFDFDLSCNTYQLPILTLHSSLDFEVGSIDYTYQTIWLNDLNGCMHKAFLDKNFTLVGTPFHFSNGFENYTYFKCPSNVEYIGHFGSISCLDDLNYTIFAVPSIWSTINNHIPSKCRAISTALLPSGTSWSTEIFGLELTWKVPDCSSCEADGMLCGFNVTSSQIMCSSSSHGISNATKKKVVFGFLLVAGVMCIIIYACRASSTRRVDVVEDQETDRRVRFQGLISELSTRVATGLDAQIIESYKKTQLGESLDLPDPNDKTCSICLGEYKSRETLRIIPECNHYFHVGCIDEWLRKNPTCPLCRNLPRTHEASLVRLRPHDEPSMC